MTVPIADYFNRITDRQTSLITNSQAFSYGTGTNRNYPNVRNALVSVDMEPMGHNSWVYRITCTSALFVDSITSGLEGEKETLGQGYVFDIVKDFNNIGYSTDGLTSTNYSTNVDGYQPGSLRCKFTGMQAIDQGNNSAALAFVFELTWRHVERKA